MATTAPAPKAIEPIPGHVWRLAAVVVIGSIMSILDTTIVNVALDTLSRKMNVTLDTAQWVVTGYMLSLAAVIPVSGWAARRFGAKQVYIFSLICFTVGSALCGISTSMTELIIFRVLQGVGGGMIMPVGQMMMAESAGPKNMGRVMSVTSIPTLLAPILGPTIGGFIVQDLSWHWIFFVNVPVGALGVLLGMRLLPNTKATKTDPLDFIGLGLLAVGLPLLTYGLAEIAAVNTFGSSKVIVPGLIGIALIALFIVHAAKINQLHARFPKVWAKRPLLALNLYRRPTFASASFVMFALGAAVFGAMILLPYYWQNLRGESVISTGLLTAPQGLGMVIAMPLVGRIADKRGGGGLALIGVIITTIATIPLAFIHYNSSIPYLFVVMMVRGAGMGMCFMPAMTAAFASLKRHELSDGSPQLNVLNRVGASLGTAVLSVVLQQHLEHAATLSHPVQRLTAEAGGYGAAFWWSVGLTAISVIPCIVMLVFERRARLAAAAAVNAELDGVDTTALAAEAMA